MSDPSAVDVPAGVDPGRRRPQRHLFLGARARGELWPAAFGTVAILVVVYGFWSFASSVTPRIWVPMLVFAGLMTVSVPICIWLSRGDRRLRRILLLCLVVKMLCVFPRYYVAEYGYKGESDAGQYDEAGRVLYDNVHHGHYSLEGSKLLRFPDETRVVGYFTGTLYLVIGTSYMGGYIGFCWVAWIGLMFFLQAFRTAFPNAPPYLAAKLLLFLPSLLYWPSSIGKDAMMVFSIGMMTYGLARLLTPNRVLGGLVFTGIGGWLITLVRPHLLAIALVGVAASFFARNAEKARTRLATGMRVALLLLLVPGLFLALNRLNATFGDERTNSLSVNRVLEKTERQTSIGDSAFEAKPVHTPLDLPVATFSVIFRPFLFEARNFAVLVSAVEGTGLLVLAIYNSSWLWRAGPAMRQHPFIAYCGAYVLAFVVAFSNVGNAGILARQRVQMFPMLMLVVAAAYEHRRLASEREAAQGAPLTASAAVPAGVG